jgi:hypothetical protein
MKQMRTDGIQSPFDNHGISKRNEGKEMIEKRKNNKLKVVSAEHNVNGTYL